MRNHRASLAALSGLAIAALIFGVGLALFAPPSAALARQSKPAPTQAATAAAVTVPPPPPASGPVTVAEATNYAATSKHADVVAFVRDLQKLTPLIRVETYFRSFEGRDVPLLVVGNPLPASPFDARTLKKPVIYVQANIHAGEVEGKEAVLMLLRDILLDPKLPYLDKLVLVVCPIFNADGNDKISPNNRRTQPGPEQGVGIRTSGQNYDLNRDAMKAESIEVQGLLERVLNRWDPILLVDCHTTDGAWHEQTVTYSWPINPNGDMTLLEFQRSKLFPEMERIMKDRYKTLGLGYGGYRDQRDPSKGWETLDPQPRYITNYIGIRNRFGILIENYVHADFKTRVAGNYACLKAILDYFSANADMLAKMIADADARTIARGLAPQAKDAFGVEFELKPLPNPITVLGYEMESVTQPGSNYPQMRRTDKKHAYTIPYFADFVPKRTVPFPAGYMIPASAASAEVVHKLVQHGLVVERLIQPATLDVEGFRMTEIKGADRLYQGHRTNTVKGTPAPSKQEFAGGSIFVTTAQPLGNLAAYLLEPESDDGLIAWNFFDKDLASGGFGGPPPGAGPGPGGAAAMGGQRGGGVPPAGAQGAPPATGAAGTPPAGQRGGGGLGGGAISFPIYKLMKAPVLVKDIVR
jgi:hypothetical protein